VVAVVHERDNLFQGLKGRAREMFSIPVGVHRQGLRNFRGPLPIIHRTGLLGFEPVATKIDGTFGDVQHKGGMIVNPKGSLETMLTQRRLDGGREGLLTVLVHVGHLLGVSVSF
jgi:hypothetical protein